MKKRLHFSFFLLSLQPNLSQHMNILHLSDLKLGLPGISPIEGANLEENCMVALHRSGHDQTVSLAVDGLEQCTFSLKWEDSYDVQTERTYADEQSVTERAAVGISVLLALRMTDYTIIERSRKGTGFDYMLGNKDDSLFAPKARLEVSGIMKESEHNTVTARYSAKLAQTDVSDDTCLPAYVSIVEFSTPKALFGIKNKEV